MNERIRKLKEKIFNSIPEIQTERAEIITKAYEEAKEEPPILRRAIAFERILEHMPVYIRDDELIVGSETEKPGSVQVFPEFSTDWILSELDNFETRKDNSRLTVKPNVKSKLRAILSKWEGETVFDHGFAQIPESGKQAIKEGIIAPISGLRYAIGHVLPDYQLVITKGFNKIIQEVQNKKQSLDISKPEDFQKNQFFDAVIMVCKAAIRFSRRYAAEAERLANLEFNEDRKKELKKIQEVCTKVPAEPAETFHEALQSFWFVHLLILLESKGMGISPGRFDQYMYPFFKKDLEKGQCTLEEAQELLACLWIKFNEVNYLLDRNMGELIGGYPSRQNLVLGGQSPDGGDATNELSFLCMKTTAELKLPQPSLSIRYHAGTPDKFMLEACKLVRLGLGFPAMYNDEIIIPALLNRGIPIEDARNYALIGCVEPAVPGKSYNAPAASKFNLVKCLELALNNGMCPLCGKQLGPRTGDAYSFSSIQDLLDAYARQVAFFVKQMVIIENIIDMTHQRLVPLPFLSSLIGGCIEKGKDVTAGGAYYNFTGPQGVGLANVADSLAAIEEVVFSKAKITIHQLKEALDNNFEGDYARIQKILEAAPKYGNDDDRVDLLAKKVLEIYAREVEKYHNPRGGQFQAGTFPATAHVSLGVVTGATPDGRKAGEAFADGISPAQQRDKKSVTAVLKSVSKLDHLSHCGIKICF